MMRARVLVTMFVVVVSWAAASAAPPADQATDLLIAARLAIGGEKADAVQTLSATGDYRRMFGEREMNGTLTIDLMAPDHYKRTDEMGFGGGPSVTRTVAVNGSDFWEDNTNRGGGGRFMSRFGGPGGPGGPDGQAPSEADRERRRQMQQQRLEGELHRYLLLWLMRTQAPVTFAGTAEASDGKADVLEIKPEGTPAMRLFLDQQTHLPLMLTYHGTMPRFVMQRRNGAAEATPSGPPSAEEMRRRMAEPPQDVTFEIRVADYKSVDGVMLPHRLTQSVDGKPMEEWTIDRFKVNPKFKPDTFEKKK
jgi:hypothetical protein